MPSRIPSQVVPSVQPVDDSPAKVRRDFRKLLQEGCVLRPAGTTRRRPKRLLELGYVPSARFRLFDTEFFLAPIRQNTDIRFFVAYLRQHRPGGRARSIFPRIFYKDVSLIWRSASHVVRSAEENWIGKGDVQIVERDGEEFVVSDESTTDLPLEIQNALEMLLRRAKRVARDDSAVELVLRGGPNDRVEPYRDFTAPRRRAQADPRNRLNRGRPVARFTRRGDPSSLRIAKGFEPDFRKGIVEVSGGSSRLYGGPLTRYRILSKNRKVQYAFFAGPRQVWIGSLQTTTTELSSYGVRTLDVGADDDLLLPGYEYHFLDESEDPPEFVSQIPAGFAGESSEVDASRADASAWLDQIPVIRAFRLEVLAKAR